MHYQLSDVSINDAEALVRQCQFPAMRQDPLRKIMFPNLDSETYGETEEEIVWTIEGLQESLQNKSCHFRQVTYGSNCVGFAIWTRASSGDGATRRQKSKPTPLEKHESWNPAGLDVEAWNQVSMRLREERQRVLLLDQQKIWRLNTISVAPEHQGNGVGSMLVRWGCDMADKDVLNCFVVASPGGLALYDKFDFKVIGEVDGVCWIAVVDY
ncbi:hypothetical protein D6C86_08401 [Aureobasidium pullulans]|uniref:N-acetyltransferase domain-containing protein n=1 Tax=Aureobasidium pullulans TaxID=5580 RepID=A0A4S9PNS2_AURPU|nr:hypothetical protein D6C94_07372 [Aureobasidium pullulans]THZ42662.1 hypothetical protein D6C87_04877 [Aureobasidium pullulans]THZ55742.1 hypothetical protein D6C86_08401 [Aureobasidium pullulans]THZ81760.1 hypothetical protein D6C88_06245 [Aureobasidium pullulans]